MLKKRITATLTFANQIEKIAVEEAKASEKKKAKEEEGNNDDKTESKSSD